MSDDEDTGFLDRLKYWIVETPDPGGNPEDNIWSDLHLFDGEWVKIQNRVDWYESPNLPSIYQDHKYILKQNMGMTRPEETYYEQNVDSNAFKSDMYSETSLPSGKGDVRILTQIWTKTAPSGDNDFGMVEYLVTTKIKYDMPNGVTFLPRIVARPLNRFFKWAFINYIGEEMIEQDGEFAIEKAREYYQYVRKYHGEEPIQTKSRQAEFRPAPEEGIFFQ